MNDKNHKIKLLSEEKVPVALLKLGLPVILGMLVSAMYNVVDAYFISWLGSSQMAAVSIVFPVVQVVIGLGLTFGVGAASCISRYLGNGDGLGASRTASTAIFSGVVAGILLTAISLLFQEELLVYLGATETIMPYAKNYFSVYILFTAVGVSYIAMNNIVISEGASRFSMIVLIFGGCLNIVLDPLLIFALEMGVYGAAVATVISQVAMLGMYCWYFFRGMGSVKVAPRLISRKMTIYTDVLKLGLPMLAFQLLSGISMGMTNTAVCRYGDAAVASMGVALRIMALASFVVFGFVKGYQPIAGYSYGAGNYARLKESTSVALRWVAVYSVAVAVLLGLFNREIMGLFSHGNTDIVRIGGLVLVYNGAVFILFGLYMVYSTIFQALGKAKESMVLGLSRQGIFFIPAILVLPGLFGIQGVIYVQPVADVLSFVLAFLLSIPLMKTVNRLVRDPVAPLPSLEKV